MKLNKKEISDCIQKFLREDKSKKDITSKYFINRNQKARATYIAEEDIILSGNNIVLEIFRKNCKNFKILFKLNDGKKIKKKKNFSNFRR